MVSAPVIVILMMDGDEVVSMVYSDSFEAPQFGRESSTTGDVQWEIKKTASNDGVRLAHSTYLQSQKTNVFLWRLIPRKSTCGVNSPA